MDLSFLKWPTIILVVVGGGWLLTSGGVNYLYGKYTALPPGADAKQDTISEAGLTRIGGYSLTLLQYQKAMNILNTACERYPQGPNFLFNRYRMARCAEKLKDYGGCVTILRSLMAVNAHNTDDRVPVNDNLAARAEKLVAVHEL